MDILVGLFLGLFGIMVCFSGLRVFFVALPLIGFVSGFFVGAAGVRAVFGESFLSSMTSVIVGLIVGVALALIAYLLWYVGALLSAGSTGALIGSGLMGGMGVNTGWIVFIGAAVGAVLLFTLAYWLALPVYVVIVNSAFIGAAAIIAGMLLVFNQLERADLGYGVAWATIEESWIWIAAWIALTAFGIVAQVQSVASVTLPEDRWSTAQASETPAV
jgi:hypothetical protein